LLEARFVVKLATRQPLALKHHLLRTVQIIAGMDRDFLFGAVARMMVGHASRAEPFIVVRQGLEPKAFHME
jgi:hypothetical protein